MTKWLVGLGLIILCMLVNESFADVGSTLILQDIGSYKRMGEDGGEGSGVLSAAGHFGEDHRDLSYGVLYFHDGDEIGVKVEVTQHAGGESDKWILHEVERGFRNPDDLESSITEETLMREISGNKLFYYGGGVVGYRWISENVVVNIQFTNLSGPKPEPLEVVSAYLALHPSTITLTDAEIKSQAHNEMWIKEEMDRRLWLSGKWMGTITNIGEDRQTKLKRVVDHLYLFLDYRDRYYGITGLNEIIQLDQKYLDQDKDAIEAKLNEYYQWWQKNKTGVINWP